MDREGRIEGPWAGHQGMQATVLYLRNDNSSRTNLIRRRLDLRRFDWRESVRAELHRAQTPEESVAICRNRYGLSPKRFRFRYPSNAFPGS